MRWLGLRTFTASAWIQTLTGELNLLHAKQCGQTKNKKSKDFLTIIRVIPRKTMLFNLTVSLVNIGKYFITNFPTDDNKKKLLKIKDPVLTQIIHQPLTRCSLWV